MLRRIPEQLPGRIDRRGTQKVEVPDVDTSKSTSPLARSTSMPRRRWAISPATTAQLELGQHPQGQQNKWRSIAAQSSAARRCYLARGRRRRPTPSGTAMRAALPRLAARMVSPPKPNPVSRMRYRHRAAIAALPNRTEGPQALEHGAACNTAHTPFKENSARPSSSMLQPPTAATLTAILVWDWSISRHGTVRMCPGTPTPTS